MTKDDERWLACLDRAIVIVGGQTTGPVPDDAIRVADELYLALKRKGR